MLFHFVPDISFRDAAYGMILLTVFLLLWILLIISIFLPHFHFADHSNVMSSVLIAAKKLSILLQQNGNMAQQPDPFTANILSTWLETHLPVCFELYLCFPFPFLKFNYLAIRLRRKFMRCMHLLLTNLIERWNTTKKIETGIRAKFTPMSSNSINETIFSWICQHLTLIRLEFLRFHSLNL